MDKQTEIKAKIGEIQLQLEGLQAQANILMENKKKLTQALLQEMNQKPSPKSKSK